MTDISTEIFDQHTLAKEGQKVPVWKARPFQLVSLLEMLKFHARSFIALIQNLEALLALSVYKDTPVNDDRKQDHLKDLEVTLLLCQIQGLEFSADYLEGVISTFKDKPSYQLLEKEIPIIQGRISDELKAPLFFYIPRDRAKYYQDEPLFGEKVADKFSKASTDIQEAGKCLAAARYTACVFHLMRVMEYSVQYLGKKLEIDLVTEKNWHNILEEVDKAIKGLPAKTSREKARRNKFSQASAFLRMVKDAWRNDVMHPKQTYTQEEAERVFRNVEDFMVHLAKKL